MKNLIILISMLLAGAFAPAYAADADPEFEHIVQEMTNEIKILNDYYGPLFREKHQELISVTDRLRTSKDASEKIDLLIEKDNLRDELDLLKRNEAQDLSKIRYLKGIQIIRLLYEKILSLDHHFASVRTFSEINKMSNPNQYPEFEKVKDLVKSKKDKKAGIDLTALLGTNTIISVVQTFSNMMISNMSKEEKEKELGNIECILDFTLRMQNDLNTIYFETSYLQASNFKMKADIETLFRDYVKPIGYTQTLENCRANDDWDAITSKTNDYLANLKTQQGPSLYTMQVNFIFPIDRLLQFIGQYNAFIDQGGKFYEKFKTILNSYENEKQCETKLPLEYKKLKGDIDVAIEKFNIAYRPIEVNGSKMKEILYGINEYE